MRIFIVLVTDSRLRDMMLDRYKEVFQDKEEVKWVYVMKSYFTY